MAFVLFFLIKAINQLHRLAIRKKEKADNIPLDRTSDEVKVLREIRDLLARQTTTTYSTNELQ